MDELFKYFDQFQQLKTADKSAIEAISSEIKLVRNAQLQSIGQACKTIYFLKKGIARIYYFKEDVEITESFSFENSLVVRYESLIANEPSKKAIQLIEDSELIAINSNELFNLFDVSQDMERLFRKIIESELVHQINRTESLQFHTADERYRELIEQAPEILKRIPLKYVASYLGITPVSLSRIRAAI